MIELVQLPKVTELIDDITSKHCKFLTSLDLRAGYWQIPISKRSRPYTTFTAPSGMRFHYTVCLRVGQLTQWDDKGLVDGFWG